MGYASLMQLTAQLLLDTSGQQADALKRTMGMTNACCNYMSGMAFRERAFSRFSLQKIAYRKARDAFPLLSSQVIIRAFAKVADAYATDREALRRFKPFFFVATATPEIYSLSDRRELLL